MWSRVVEVMLGFWLLATPFIFQFPAAETVAWANTFGCAVVVAGLALLSFWAPTRHAHWLLVVVALWMVAYSYLFASRAVAADAQNAMSVGLCLLMFAVIPNEASKPPAGWRTGE